MKKSTYIALSLIATSMSASSFAGIPAEQIAQTIQEKKSKAEYDTTLRRVQELEAEQKRLLNDLDASKRNYGGSQQEPLDNADVSANKENLGDSDVLIEPGIVESTIAPSTKDLAKVFFALKVHEKIEKEGTCNFPHIDRKMLYGNLIVSIPIFQDGTIYLGNGGAKVERTSGKPVLDKAALRIVRDSAPFNPIPERFQKPSYKRVWTIISRFDFARVEGDDSKIDCGKKP